LALGSFRMDFVPDSAGESVTNAWTFIKISGTDIACDQDARFYTRYLIELQHPDGSTSVIARRYREFRSLYESIRELPATERPQRSELPRITSKKLGSSLAEELINKRMRKLSEFLLVISSVALLFPAVKRELVLFFTADSIVNDEVASAVRSRPFKSSIIPTALAEGAILSAAPAPQLRSSIAVHDIRPGVSDAAVDTVEPCIEIRCNACDKPLSDSSFLASALSWDSSRFCSPQCERFFAAMNKKGFTIAAIGGKRQVATVHAASSAMDASPDVAPAIPSVVTPVTAGISRLASLRTASMWWGSARKGLSAPNSEPRLPSSVEEGGTNNRRGSSFAAASISGDEAERHVSVDVEEEEQRKFFSSRRKPRDNARVLTKWNSVRALLHVSSSASLVNSQRFSRENSREMDTTTGTTVEAGSRTSSGSGGVYYPPPPPAPRPIPPPPPTSISRSRSSGTAASIIEVVHHRGVMWKRGGYKGGRKTWKLNLWFVRFFFLAIFGGLHIPPPPPPQHTHTHARRSLFFSPA
jgi:hypothetical protein